MLNLEIQITATATAKQPRLPRRWNLQQQRSQPDDLVPLCKYLRFTDCENNQFVTRLINDDTLKFV